MHALHSRSLFSRPDGAARPSRRGVSGSAPSTFPTSCTARGAGRSSRARSRCCTRSGTRRRRRRSRDVRPSDPAVRDGVVGRGDEQLPPGLARPTPAELARGGAAAAKAKAIGAKTDREKGYIDAIAAFYSDTDTLDPTRAPCLRSGDGAARAANPGRRRGGDLLCTVAHRHGMSTADRQDVRVPEAGGGDPQPAAGKRIPIIPASRTT